MLKRIITAIALLNLLGCEPPQPAVPHSADEAAALQVRMQTSEGDIVLALDRTRAPTTVANFLGYVESKSYNGTIFHRIIDGFMIQGGGYDKDFQKRDTRLAIRNEANNGLKNTRGTIAMARTGDPHSATAQFFINVADNVFLDHKSPTPQGWGYAVFGKVIAGMDTVDRIRTLPTGPGGPFPRDVPQTPVIIHNVTLETGQQS